MTTRRQFLTTLVAAPAALLTLGRAKTGEVPYATPCEWVIPPLSELLGPTAHYCVYQGVQQAKLRAEGWEINLIEYAPLTLEEPSLRTLRLDRFVIPFRQPVDPYRLVVQGATRCWRQAQRWDDTRGVFVPIRDLQIHWWPWEETARSQLPLSLRHAVATAHWHEDPVAGRTLTS